MPSKSPKQRRIMAAAAHDPQFAKKVGIPVTVAKEFYAADKAGSSSHKGLAGGKRGRPATPRK